VPQAQKNKKPVSVSPNFTKSAKENITPGQPDGANANKSEIPEESVQHDLPHEDEHEEEHEDEQPPAEVQADAT